ncbi:hypothetical protein TNCV_3389641 [Trichonephila clavipes]|nr:hypothetical protein TNCV_3389641 [Trichonephila clavipes]
MKNGWRIDLKKKLLEKGKSRNYFVTNAIMHLMPKRDRRSWTALVELPRDFTSSFKIISLTSEPPPLQKVLDESRSFFRVHTGYFSNIPKCIKAEFIASWACSQSSVVSSSKR